MTIVFKQDFKTAFKLVFGVNLVCCKKFYVLFVKQMGQCVGCCLKVGKASSLGLGNPVLVVAVAVENNAVVLLNGFSYKVVKCGLKVFGNLKLIFKKA